MKARDSEGYTRDGRNRACFACNDPIGQEAMVIMRPTDKVNETERVFHARCVKASDFNATQGEHVI